MRLTFGGRQRKGAFRGGGRHACAERGTKERRSQVSAMQEQPRAWASGGYGNGRLTALRGRAPLAPRPAVAPLAVVGRGRRRRRVVRVGGVVVRRRRAVVAARVLSPGRVLVWRRRRRVVVRRRAVPSAAASPGAAATPPGPPSRPVRIPRRSTPGSSPARPRARGDPGPRRRLLRTVPISIAAGARLQSESRRRHAES